MLYVDEEGGYISLSDSEIERWSKEFDFTAPPFVSKELYNNFLAHKYLCKNILKEKFYES